MDAALQFQPFMLGKGFATQIVAPTAMGQPVLVSAAVKWAATVILAHTVLWDVLFANVQIVIGAGLLFRRTARLALVLSFFWAAGVWYMGEGLGQMLGGTAVFLNGAPGAVALYGLVGLAAWPRLGSARRRLLMGGIHDPAMRGGLVREGTARGGSIRGRSVHEVTAAALSIVPDERPAGWVPLAWAVLWMLFGSLRALPGNDSAALLAKQLTAMARGAPAWLADAQRTAASTAAHAGVWSVAALVVVEVAIGLAALWPGPARAVAAWSGIGVSLLFWVIGQAFGGISTGMGTDPNSGLLVALFGCALLGVAYPSADAHRGDLL